MVTFLAHADSPDVIHMDSGVLDMDPEELWEQQTLALIRKLEQDRLVKAEQRLSAAQRNYELVRGQIETLRGALDIYRSEHGIEQPSADTYDAAELASYHGMSPREMLQRWADTHDGELVMKEIARFLTAAGLFRDEIQAAGTLYPTVRRLEGFRKTGRGLYRRDVPHAMTEEGPLALYIAGDTHELRRADQDQEGF